MSDIPHNLLTPESIIRLLNLKPHPEEGGFYRETYRSDETIYLHTLPGRYTGLRAFGTAIYYLLTPETCSYIHRLPTDEVFHFYLGGPVLMLHLYADLTSRTIIAGNDIVKGQSPQIVVPRGTWQGTYLIEGEALALMGTTMAPGFDFEDYEQGERGSLIRLYPERRELIERLTLE